MAIPGSGALSAQTINFELGRGRASTLSIDTAENGGYGTINQNSPSRPNPANPAAYSEWYNYDHTAGGGGGLPAITLGYDASRASTACSRFFLGPNGIYYINEADWLASTQLYLDSAGSSFAATGWYSDGSIDKFWSNNRGGGAFSLFQACTL